MTEEQIELRQRLNAYFDHFCETTDYLQRLAEENGWSDFAARRVLQEYKKFLFLARESGHGVVPPQPVAQAWRLHLVYPESYRGEFRQALGMEPDTRALEAPVYEEQTGADFQKTLESYRRFFGEYPPDIWYLTLPKSSGKARTLGALLLACVAGIMAAVATAYGLKSIPGLPVLVFIFVTLFGTLAFYRLLEVRAAKQTPRRPKPEEGVPF